MHACSKRTSEHRLDGRFQQRGGGHVAGQGCQPRHLSLGLGVLRLQLKHSTQVLNGLVIVEESA